MSKYTLKALKARFNAKDMTLEEAAYIAGELLQENAELERERDVARVKNADLRGEVRCLQVRERRLEEELGYLRKRLKGARDVINWCGQHRTPPPKICTQGD